MKFKLKRYSQPQCHAYLYFIMLLTHLVLQKLNWSIIKRNWVRRLLQSDLCSSNHPIKGALRCLKIYISSRAWNPSYLTYIFTTPVCFWKLDGCSSYRRSYICNSRKSVCKRYRITVATDDVHCTLARFVHLFSISNKRRIETLLYKNSFIRTTSLDLFGIF